MSTQLQHISTVIYQLKRQYGREIGIYEDGDQVLDPQTGVTTRTRIKLRVKKAVILPTRVVRDFVYDLSFIAANKNFTYGGLFDTSTRNVLVDAKDIPKTWNLQIDQFMVIDQRRFQIKDIQELEPRKAFILVGIEIKGEKKYAIVEKFVVQRLDLTQTAIKV